MTTWLLQRLYGAIAAVYPGLLRWSLNHRPAVVITAVLIFLGTMTLIPRLGTELIPQFSQGEFDVDLNDEGNIGDQFLGRVHPFT